MLIHISMHVLQEGSTEGPTEGFLIKQELFSKAFQSQHKFELPGFICLYIFMCAHTHKSVFRYLQSHRKHVYFSTF